jgi:hypothetical protein
MVHGEIKAFEALVVRVMNDALSLLKVRKRPSVQFIV